MPNYRTYLKTLRRIPDDAILDMATREFDMGDPETCICGWAFAEALAIAAGAPAEDVKSCDWVTNAMCCNVFGGTQQEWLDIFGGVTSETTMPLIELAFVHRVEEACRA